ncbi:hypothetical protein IWX76_002602 [Pedobacter sp. CAN_A7]|uniref:hypothetical protein n=1 Tax=Pedobacter sp. CAN_A7 TaxID=2787722 RepID=UPI0018CBA868
MVRSSIAFLLIFTTLTANLSQYFVYVGFEFNKNYIATVLCVNRDKPVLQCNGKCYLSKRLKQAAEKEKNQERAAKKSVMQEACLSQEIVMEIPSQLLKPSLVLELPFALPKHSALIFHPPQV